MVLAHKSGLHEHACTSQAGWWGWPIAPCDLTLDPTVNGGVVKM